MHGFQLWANLPSSLKMTPPRYQEVKAGDVPVVTDDDGTQVRVVCGSFGGEKGPVDGIAADPVYVDVSVPPGKRKSLSVATAHHGFAYVFAGSGQFSDASQPLAVPTETFDTGDSPPVPVEEVDNRSLVLFDRGDEVTVQAGEEGIRFLLVSGKPLREPVAWRGPIVMNTQEEQRRAYEDLQRGNCAQEAKTTPHPPEWFQTTRTVTTCYPTGPAGLEPATPGFGVRCSSSRPVPTYERLRPFLSRPVPSSPV